MLLSEIMSAPTTILVDIGDEQSVIDEERQSWLRRVLVALGADEEIISENTMEAKRHLGELDLIVWRFSDGSLRVYRPQYEVLDIEQEKGAQQVPVEKQQKLLAEWLPPKLVRVREGGGREHYRITLREWALPFQMGEI
jgi:hypothetical protein